MAVTGACCSQTQCDVCRLFANIWARPCLVGILCVKGDVNTSAQFIKHICLFPGWKLYCLYNNYFTTVIAQHLETFASFTQCSLTNTITTPFSPDSTSSNWSWRARRTLWALFLDFHCVFTVGRNVCKCADAATGYPMNPNWYIAPCVFAALVLISLNDTHYTDGQAIHSSTHTYSLTYNKDVYLRFSDCIYQRARDTLVNKCVLCC